MTLETRKPVPRYRRPALKNTDGLTVSRMVREVVATLAIGALVATLLWSSVFGMAADLSSGPVAISGPHGSLYLGGRTHGE